MQLIVSGLLSPSRSVIIFSSALVESVTLIALEITVSGFLRVSLQADTMISNANTEIPNGLVKSDKILLLIIPVVHA